MFRASVYARAIPITLAVILSLWPISAKAAEDNGFDPFLVDELSAPDGVATIPDPTGSAPTAEIYSFRIPSGYCNPMPYEPGSTQSDCDFNSVRSQIRENVFATSRNGDVQPSESWYSFAMFVPEDFPYGARQTNGLLSLFYFHNKQCPHIALVNFAGNDDGLYLAMSNSIGNHDCTPGARLKVADFKDLAGKWSRFELFVKWADDESGQAKVYLDGKLMVEWNGVTLTPGLEDVNYTKFGIYVCCTNDVADIKAASLYYAAVKRADKREGLFTEEDRAVLRSLQTALNDLGCSVGSADGILGNKTRSMALSCRAFPEDRLPASLNVATVRDFLALYSAPGVADLPAGTLAEPETEVAVVSNAKPANAPADVLKPEFVVHTVEGMAQKGGGSDLVSTFDVKIEASSGAPDFAFLAVGSFFGSENDPGKLELFLSEPSELTDELKKCGRPTISFPDGTVHVALYFSKVGKNFIPPSNAECLANALPQDQANAIRFLTTNFADIAIGAVVDGSVDLIQYEEMQAFIKRVAMGEIEVGT